MPPPPGCRRSLPPCSSGAFAAAAASAGSGAAAIAIFVGLVFAAFLIVVPRITPLPRPILFISLNERPG